jgi:hypothetical protein
MQDLTFTLYQDLTLTLMSCYLNVWIKKIRYIEGTGRGMGKGQGKGEGQEKGEGKEQD